MQACREKINTIVIGFSIQVIFSIQMRLEGLMTIFLWTPGQGDLNLKYFENDFY